MSQPATVATAAEWNQLFVPGWPVFYRPLLNDAHVVPSRTRSFAWNLGHGAPIVKIAGVAGGVSLEHLSTRIDECPRKCATCVDSLHHWYQDSTDPDWIEPDDVEREAAEYWRRHVEWSPQSAPTCPLYWVCKHCEIWLPYLNLCDECEGPADGSGRCISWPEHW